MSKKELSAAGGGGGPQYTCTAATVGSGAPTRDAITTASCDTSVPGGQSTLGELTAASVSAIGPEVPEMLTKTAAPTRLQQLPEAPPPSRLSGLAQRSAKAPTPSPILQMERA
ncbi:hypothetical protein HYH02_012703 [Chlamydomonas schloesseri]|uniref:Uncharacterized protein n=1 Tax=Chlamydomonas schloesseri TaxID=2026947 RepID=A0A835T3G4_9CHLO|nr:hypothetical protein HYH02_012703 [Chlamydomonas schloesseri]|eukprot:KAG2433159.1 hypothetical protein HYH02_012703 [Chlamydomonas schloesseri]